MMQLVLWIKVIHIVSVIAWMAGLLYLPRLFVYHSRVSSGSETSEIFKIMERRLLKAIMNPAMTATWATGLYMAYKFAFFTQMWFHAKMSLVLAMSGFHGYLAAQVRNFAGNRNIKSEVYYRVINEIPTILMILIVTLVVIKPF